MEISATGAAATLPPLPATEARQDARAATSAAERATARPEEGTPSDSPAPMLIAHLAATEISRLAVAQDSTLRQMPGSRAEAAQVRAVRAYEETALLLNSAKALIDRVVLLPEKGDMALEASKLPPWGPPAFGPPPRGSEG